MKDKISILGTEYKIYQIPSDRNPKLENNYAFCEQYAKKIVISDFKEEQGNKMSVENFVEFEKQVIRHEIIHAYFGESGLRNNSDYAENEELVDWIAIQLPKIVKTCEELEIL